MYFARSAGILVHPSSFPSDYGIGDFSGSAYDFIDFLYGSGIKIWQVLPLSPTSYGDSPYQSFSTNAGNHLLISPDILYKKNLLHEEDLLDRPLTSSTNVDFGTVINFKNNLLKKAYHNFKKTITLDEKEDFNAFKEENKDWLYDYSLFVAIKNHLIRARSISAVISDYYAFRDAYKEYMDENSIISNYFGASYISWPIALIKRDQETMDEYKNILSDEIEYQCFLQYEFFDQWFKLKEYANKKDIQIIGDEPIFISSDSADVWAKPGLFLLDEKGRQLASAGVPPDYFSETGQLWGNPLYNWEEHKKEHYAWWIKRIEQSLKMYDIIRIDHFRGFESYWEVPFGNLTAEKGKWVKGPGKEIFMEMEKKLGKLPLIAEDLGIITEDVRKLRDELGFPGMAILQFAFDTDSTNAYLPHNIKDNHIIMYTGTHDNDTSLGWYKNASDEAKDYFRRYLNVSGADASWDLIRLCYSSSAKLAIFPIQDLMSLGSNARMNTPGEARENWSFRYTENMLNEDIKERLLYFNKLYNR